MRCSGHNGCLVNFTEWSTVMSVQPFGFGTRSYVFDAVRSLFGLRNMFGGRSLSFRNMNAARRGSLPGPIIMKLCSGRVRNSFISCNAQWGNCVSGHSRTLLENPCVSFDFRPEIISCADISLLKKSAIYSFFYSSTTDVFCTGQGHLSLSSGTKLQKGGRLWVTILSAVTPELCSESWTKMNSHISFLSPESITQLPPLSAPYQESKFFSRKLVIYFSTALRDNDKFSDILLNCNVRISCNHSKNLPGGFLRTFSLFRWVVVITRNSQFEYVFFIKYRICAWILWTPGKLGNTELFYCFLWKSHKTSWHFLVLWYIV